MLFIVHSLNALLMIVLPLLLGLFLWKKLGAKWSLFGIGAVTFIASQVVHIPLLQQLTALFANKTLPAPPAAWQLTFNAVVLGLAAGLCEELARYLVYRFWIRSARTWREALMFGAGHGGIEAILLGGYAGLVFLNMAALQNTPPASLPVSAAQQSLLAAQIAAYWSTPWYLALLGAVERVFALCIHLSSSVLVLQAFTRKNILWLAAAIVWHALVDGVSVFAVSTVGPYQTEAIIGLLALVGVVIILALRPRQPEAAPEPAPSVVLAGAPPSPRTADKAQADVQQQVDQSKYTN